MDLDALRIFLAVADYGGVTAAASRLHTVQSNVTARLKRLEDDLGCPLFLRLPRGMALSGQGRELLPFARRMLALAAQARQAVSPGAEPAGPLGLGAFESTAAVRLPPVLGEMRRRHPGLDVSLRISDCPELSSAVASCRLDAAFLSQDFERPELAASLAFREELCLVAPLDCPDWRQALARDLLVFPQPCAWRQGLERWLAAEGLRPGGVMELATVDGILAMTAAGLGVSLLPESNLDRWRERVRVFAAPDREREHAVYLVYRADNATHPGIRALMGVLAELGPYPLASAVPPAAPGEVGTMPLRVGPAG